MSSQVQASGEDAAATTPDDEAAEAADERELPLEQVFDVLKNERRRLVLSHLNERESEVPIGELAEHIAAHENDKSVTQLSSDERKRAYVGLYQCHLPKMDAMEIVEFNKNRGRIQLGPNYPLVEPYVDAEYPPEGVTDRWPWFYLTVAVVAGAMLLVTTFQSAALARLSASLTVVAFGLLSLYHWWTVPGEEENGEDD